MESDFPTVAVGVHVATQVTIGALIAAIQVTIVAIVGSTTIQVIIEATIIVIRVIVATVKDVIAVPEPTAEVALGYSIMLDCSIATGSEVNSTVTLDFELDFAARQYFAASKFPNRITA